MSILKRFIRSDGFRHALCWIGAGYIRFVNLTGRWQVIRGHIPEQYWNTDKPFILSFWHGRLLMMPMCWKTQKQMHMLISQHRDGQIIAQTIRHFGIKTTAGSSSKGGARALRSILKTISQGAYIGITPDGPRGPRMRLSEGIVTIARLSGAPIIPIAHSCRNGRHLKSWDRFLITYPFTKNVVVWGEPIEVPRDIDAAGQEQARLEIEAALNAATLEADELTGRTPVEAAPLAGNDQ